MTIRSAAAMMLPVLVGCTESGLPRIQIPQVEQARQEVQGGIGKRYEDHGACQKTATDVDSLVACMDIAGYEYLPRSAEQQAMECWRLRDPLSNKDGRLPESLCFRHRTPAAQR